MENTFLYIIRNTSDFGSSILGVYTSARAAKDAIEYNEKNLIKKGYIHMDYFDYLEAIEDGEDPKIIPEKEVKVVLANGLNYNGCSAYSIKDLLKDPEGFEETVKAWFKNSSFSMSRTTDDLYIEGDRIF